LSVLFTVNKPKQPPVHQHAVRRNDVIDGGRALNHVEDNSVAGPRQRHEESPG
jgi:hypothetical protein